MTHKLNRTVCWKPLWNANHRGLGLKHLVLENLSASSVVLAINEDGAPVQS